MAAQSTHRRWFQWRLRTLLAVVTFCAVATAFFIAPRVREQAVIAWLREQEAGLTLEADGPEWLRRLIGEKFLQHVVAVEVRKTPIAGADLSRFDDLPRLRTLHFMQSILCDFMIPRPAEPERLDAVTTSRLSPADVEGFVDKHPAVDCDVAFAESLYQASLRAYQNDPGRQLRDVIFACQIAARWKMACAEYKPKKTAGIDAHGQLLDWLQRIASQVEGGGVWHPEGGTPYDVALVKCAVTNAELVLSCDQGRAAAERAIIDEGSAAAALLLSLTDQTAINAGPIDPYRLDFAWSNAIELLLAKARLEGGAAKQAVLKRQVDALRDVAAKVGDLYLRGSRGGEVEKLELSRINLMLAEARLARARGDKNAERLTLQGALPMVERLRQAIDACYDMGTIRGADVLYADERATELETTYARAIGDTDLGRRVRDARIDRIEHFWRKRAALSLYSVGGMPEDETWIACLLRCLLAIHRLENEGRAAYEAPISSFAPRLQTPQPYQSGDEMPGIDEMPDDDEMPGDCGDVIDGDAHLSVDNFFIQYSTAVLSTSRDAPHATIPTRVTGSQKNPV